MPDYANRGGDSAIVRYEVKVDSIEVYFRGRTRYLYTNSVTGAIHVARMKALAERGEGLGAYITNHVREGFASKARW
jgi:hypothetical protein